MESAIADIQLFGTPVQLALLRSFTTEATQAGQVSASGHDLLANLRDDLRAELQLERAEGSFMFYRATSPVSDDDQK
jgi:hypothetical protein